MKLEINDYIKINGFISKIDYIKKTKNGNEYVQFKEPNGMISHINSKLIEKASHNIIDLIEVGDYVNSYKVLFIDYDLGLKELKHKNIKCIGDTEDRETFYNEDIKTILTHEQFENNCYKIEN